MILIDGLHTLSPWWAAEVQYLTWANDKKKNGAYGPVDKALQFKLRYVKSDLFELRIKM